MIAQAPVGSSDRAGFWQRAAAWSIDAALIAPFALLLTWPWIAAPAHAGFGQIQALLRHVGRAMGAAIIDGVSLPLWASSVLHDPATRDAIAAIESSSWSSAWPLLFAFALLGAAYQAACECSPRQASLGKRLLRVHVRTRDGRRLGPGRALARYGAGALSWATLNLGHLMATLAPEHLALHDRCSGTRVLADDGADPGLPTWAWAWLVLLALVGLGVTVWLAAAATAIMRAALEQALF